MIGPSFHTFTNPPEADVVNFAAIGEMIAYDAITTDEDAAFPLTSIARLADTGWVAQPLPEDTGNARLLERLVWAGRSSLTVGRLFEGHVNGAVLLRAYGNAENRNVMTTAAGQGLITGVWNAQRGKGLLAERCNNGWILNGSKIFCSGAGSIRFPIVTAGTAHTGAVLMMMPDMNSPKAKVDLSSWRPAGMRGTATGTVSFEQFFVPDYAVIGEPDDYYRSPLFSGGAWRVLAVQLGGLQHIVSLHAQRLIEWNRCADPNLRGRFAVATQNLEHARLLVCEAARRAADPTRDADAIDAYVDSARTAFEPLALAIIENTRRNIGLSTFIKPDPLDLVIRDLETYLRQPFLDASRDNAVTHLLGQKGSFAT